MRSTFYIIVLIIYLSSLFAGFYYEGEIYSSHFEIFEKQQEGSFKLIFSGLLENNLLVILTNILSFCSFGLISFYNLIANGFSLGIVLSRTINTIGINKMIINILPYGLFEIMGLWLSCFAGFLGTIIIYRLITKNILLLKDIKIYLFFSLVSVILTILSSFLETLIIINM